MTTRLITGGLGFAGNHFLRQTLRMFPDMNVVVYDRQTYAGRQANISDIWANSFLSRNLRVDIGDLSSPIDPWVSKKWGDVNEIVHLSAETMVDRSIDDLEPFLRSNIHGALNLLRYAKTLPNLKKIVWMSTDEVYGPSLTADFDEESRLNPTNPYAWSKASADLLANAFYHTWHLPVIWVHSMNLFGERQHAEKLIPKTIRCVLKNDTIPVYGDGKHKRTWVYVHDFCDGLEFITQAGKIGEHYHIVGSQEFRNIDLIKSIAHAIGKEPKLQFVPDDVARPGHDRRYGMKDTKLAKLGWQPLTPFPQAIENTIEWYRKNTDWLV